MRKFENLKMVLFDSTKASFKLTVEAQFTRGNKEQGYRDLVYVTDRYTGMLNPNIYLTLAYKDDNANPVYTSYPQLFRLREAFEKIKNLVADESGFIELEGQLTVRPDCTEPVILTNIGKNNNWISIKLAVFQSGENGVTTTIPGVAIELSTANRFVSTLTVDEFLTLYTIIKDLDLSSLQCMMSLAFLDTERYNNNIQYQQPYGQPEMNYRQTYPSPQQYQGYVQQPYTPRQYSAPQPQQRQYPQGQQVYAAQPRYNNVKRTYQQSPVQQPVQEDETPMIQPIRQQVNNMTPREPSKPIMNLAAVESTPISEISYEDANGLDDIFNN